MNNASLGVFVTVGILVLALTYGRGAPADRPIPKDAIPISDVMTMVVVETDSCGWCIRFREDAAPVYGLPAFEPGPACLSRHKRAARLQVHLCQPRSQRGDASSRAQTHGGEIKRYKAIPAAGNSSCKSPKA